MTARFAEVPWKCAVRCLQREFPVDHSASAQSVVVVAGVCGRGEEGLDDVAGRLRVTRKPAVLEAPPGRNAARIALAVAGVLRAAEPDQRGREVLFVRVSALARRGAEVGDEQ